MRRLAGIFLQIVGAFSLLSFVIAAGSILFAGYWMDLNEEPVTADYILPLAGDGHRMIKAAELYRQGYAPAILLSNARQLPPTRQQRLHWQMGYPRYSREQYLSLLLPLLGVESARLEEFGNGHISTVEEAEALRRHLNDNKVTLLIVTSPYHARRAKMIFEDILPESTIVVTTTREGGFEKRWWAKQTSAQNIIIELAKTLHYLAGGVFRSTDEPSPAEN